MQGRFECRDDFCHGLLVSPRQNRFPTREHRRPFYQPTPDIAVTAGGQHRIRRLGARHDLLPLRHSGVSIPRSLHPLTDALEHGSDGSEEGRGIGRRDSKVENPALSQSQIGSPLDPERRCHVATPACHPRNPQGDPPPSEVDGNDPQAVRPKPQGSVPEEIGDGARVLAEPVLDLLLQVFQRFPARQDAQPLVEPEALTRVGDVMLRNVDVRPRSMLIRISSTASSPFNSRTASCSSFR